MLGFAASIVATVVVRGTGFSPYISDPRVVPLLAGALAGLITGLLSGWMAGRVVSPDATFPDQKAEILQRAREACGRLSDLRATGNWVPSNVDTLLNDLVATMGRPGAQWMDASGFLDAWGTLHEAEENLLFIDSVDKVTSAALYDLLRLTKSMIPGKDALTEELKTAMPFLADSAADQIGAQHAAHKNEFVARERIRHVRMAIDMDREQQWDQIVRSRNGLLSAGVVSMAIAYIVVVLAVGFSASPKALGSGLVFALIGGLVSAAHQFLIRSHLQSEVEDFGFVSVRLLVVPILSGLVAVLAVVLLTQIQLTLSGQSLGGSFTSWQATFDWRKNPSAIEIAIIFGLAPSLFFSLVKSRVDDALNSIKSSQPSGAASS